MDTTIQVLANEEIGRAASLIARAFHEDPLNVYLFPDDAERALLSPRLFDALVRHDQSFGRVDRLADFAAVATWQRPGSAGETASEQDGFDERLEAVMEPITRAVERIEQRPHWHLDLLAVDPDRQSAGLGATLLEHGLRRADADGCPVVLETFAERTVPFYIRNGFQVILGDVEPKSGLRFWALCR